MSITAVLSTYLGETDLEKAALDPETNRYHNVHIALPEIILDNRATAILDAGKSSSTILNLESGGLIVGNISDQDTLCNKLFLGRMEEECAQAHPNTVEIHRKSIIFELERLFGKKLCTLDMVDYLEEGEQTLLGEKGTQKVAVSELLHKYKKAREASVLGLPAIEMDFRAGMRWSGHPDMEKIYGKELYAILMESRRQIAQNRN